MSQQQQPGPGTKPASPSLISPQQEPSLASQEAPSKSFNESNTNTVPQKDIKMETCDSDFNSNGKNMEQSDYKPDIVKAEVKEESSDNSLLSPSGGKGAGKAIKSETSSVKSEPTGDSKPSVTPTTTPSTTGNAESTPKTEPSGPTKFPRNKKGKFSIFTNQNFSESRD